MIATSRHPTLHLNDPVHVAAGGRVVPVRRKGLAMLAYVALEGPTRRERLADVLWDQRRALPNLRVELHRLRAAFGVTGVDPITRSADALALAPEIEVDTVARGNGLLTGLEDVSGEYQEWLDHRRALATNHRGHAIRTALLDELAAHVAPPFVLVLEGPPGSGRRGLTKDLARRLGLPYTENPPDDRVAVRYLAPDQQADDLLATRIIQDDRSVWSLGRSPFGMDSRLLLRLRAQMPPERMRFVSLGPISWDDALPSLPKGVGFPDGARLYLTAGGNPGYLTELVKLHERGALHGDLPVPQRMRAAVLLEAEHLSVDSRRALERLSVHSGTYSNGLLAALEVGPQADELERMGWLTYDGAVWRFNDPIAARMVRAGVPSGLRLRLRRRIADHLEREGALASAAHDRRSASGDDEHSTPAAAPPATLPGIVRRQVSPGPDVWLDELSVEGDRVSLDDGRSTWSRLATDRDVSRVAWRLPGTPVLLRLRGRAFVTPDDAGTVPESVLVLSVTGGAVEAVHLGTEDRQGRRADGSVMLPLPPGERFEHWLSIPCGRELWLESVRANAVIETEIEAFEPAPKGGDPVDAIDLSPVPMADVTETDSGLPASEGRAHTRPDPGVSPRPGYAAGT